MPKKFGTNTKKEEAKERDAQKKKAQTEDKIRKAEDENWREDDDKVNKKLQKEKEKEKKRLDELKRKQENKEAVEREMEELTQQKTKNNQVKPPTRKEIEEYKEKTIKKLLEQNKQEKIKEVEQIDVEKEYINPNYGKLDQRTTGGHEVIDISGVEEALIGLSMTEFDKHPEKRMKAAWTAYMEKQLPIYKADYPNMKRSQLLDMISKEFKKSPENPVYLKQLKTGKEDK